MSNEDLLFKLTGLSPLDVGRTLASNPRAYMALKGAVAEKHLENYFHCLKECKQIYDFRKGVGDSEKDFYIQIRKRGRKLAVECKNVEVIKITNHIARSLYLKYLRSHNLVSEFAHDLDILDSLQSEECIRKLSIEHRESGLSRYSFSKYLAGITNSINELGDEKYLEHFKQFPISIDFQRTRNSQEDRGSRFYKEGEVDIIAACLFSRTLEWQFIFCSAENLPRHKIHHDCFSPSLKIDPTKWKSSFIEVL